MGGHYNRKTGGYHFHNSKPVPSAAKRVYVRGYYRKDGTYVRPHYRTTPDGNPYNNYSTRGLRISVDLGRTALDAESMSQSAPDGQLAALILHAYGTKASDDSIRRKAMLDKIELEYDKKLFRQKQAAAKELETLSKQLQAVEEKYKKLLAARAAKKKRLTEEFIRLLQAGKTDEALLVATMIPDIDAQALKLYLDLFPH